MWKGRSFRKNEREVDRFKEENDTDGRTEIQRSGEMKKACRMSMSVKGAVSFQVPQTTVEVTFLEELFSENYEDRHRRRIPEVEGIWTSVMPSVWIGLRKQMVL